MNIPKTVNAKALHVGRVNSFMNPAYTDATTESHGTKDSGNYLDVSADADDAMLKPSSTLNKSTNDDRCLASADQDATSSVQMSGKFPKKLAAKAAENRCPTCSSKVAFCVCNEGKARARAQTMWGKQAASSSCYALDSDIKSTNGAPAVPVDPVTDGVKPSSKASSDDNPPSSCDAIPVDPVTDGVKPQSKALANEDHNWLEASCDTEFAIAALRLASRGPGSYCFRSSSKTVPNKKAIVLVVMGKTEKIVNYKISILDCGSVEFEVHKQILKFASLADCISHYKSHPELMVSQGGLCLTSCIPFADSTSPLADEHCTMGPSDSGATNA